MNKLVAKILGIGFIVISEVEKDLADGNITVGEILNITRDILDKLGYLNKPVVKLKSGN